MRSWRTARIWISGMLALDKEGTLVGGDDVVAQAERVHENIKAALDKGARVLRTWSR